MPKNNKEFSDLTAYLDEQAELYNCIDFIDNDPISLPHRFTKIQDREIIGFGVLMGIFIEEAFRMPDAGGVIPSVLISGGLALLLYYKITKDNAMEDRITKDREHETV